MFYTKTMFFLTAGSRPLDLDFDRTNRLLECRENAYFYNQDMINELPSVIFKNRNWIRRKTRSKTYS